MTTPAPNVWLVLVPLILAFATAALANILLFLGKRQDQQTAAAAANAAAAAVTAAAAAAAATAAQTARDAAAATAAAAAITARDILEKRTPRFDVLQAELSAMHAEVGRLKGVIAAAAEPKP